MHYSSTSRQAKRYILRLFALTIGVLMIILSSGCQPTDNNTETRDSIGQIQKSSVSTFVKVTISVKTVNDTVCDDRCHERFCCLTIRESVYKTRDSLQVETIKHKKKTTSSSLGIPRVASFWYSSSVVFGVVFNSLSLESIEVVREWTPTFGGSLVVREWALYMERSLLIGDYSRLSAFFIHRLGLSEEPVVRAMCPIKVVHYFITQLLNPSVANER